MTRDHVLVIDDDPDFRELVACLLSDWGLTAVEAPDSVAALPLLDEARGRVRAVLLDYFMPGPPPRDSAQAILQRVEPGVPVVLVSAAVDIAARAAEVGLARYLAKPFEIADLQAVVAGASFR